MMVHEEDNAKQQMSTENGETAAASRRTRVLSDSSGKIRFDLPVQDGLDTAFETGLVASNAPSVEAEADQMRTGT